MSILHGIVLDKWEQFEGENTYFTHNSTKILFSYFEIDARMSASEK